MEAAPEPIASPPQPPDQPRPAPTSPDQPGAPDREARTGPRLDGSSRITPLMDAAVPENLVTPTGFARALLTGPML